MNKKEYKYLIDGLGELRSVKPKAEFIKKMDDRISYFLSETKTNSILYFTGYRLRFVLIIVVFLFLSFSGVVLASQKSKPGSVLYPVKRAVNSLRIQFSSDPKEKAFLNLENSEDKLEEIEKYIHKSNTQKLKNKLNEYSETVDEVVSDTKKFSNEEKNAVNQVVDSLNNQERTLVQMRNQVSNEIQTEFNNALESSSEGQNQFKQVVKNNEEYSQNQNTQLQNTSNENDQINNDTEQNIQKPPNNE